MIDLDLFFSISQGTLPWQPILGKIVAKLPTLPVLIALSFRNDIVLQNSILIAPLIAGHRVKNGENRFSSF